MKKKIISFALALLMCLSLLSTVVSAKEIIYLKDMLDTFSGTYVFSNDVTYGDTFQTGTATLTLNENELSFEILMIFYHLQDEQKTVDLNIATKFKFDENGYNDWETTTFVDGKPQYVEGGLVPDYNIGNLLEDTKVEYLDKEKRYKISVFDMMDFYFCDIENGKAQKTVFNDTVFERNENDQIAIPTPFIGQAATPTKITPTTTEWSGWMVADSKVEINGNVTVSGKAYLLLTDDAELTVNGSIDAGRNNYDNMLTVYAQNTGTGSLTVNGKSNLGMGYLGSITVNGGNITINGGTGSNFGICYGNAVNVAGGVLTVIGGDGGGDGISQCAVTVSGGELYSFGGNSDHIGGIGVSNSIIMVTGGSAVIAGGFGDFGDFGGGRRYYAFSGNDEMIDAKIFYSIGDIKDLKYYPITKSANNYHILKLLPKTSPVQAVSYIDAQGNEQMLDTQPTEITKDTTELSGWMIASENVTIDCSVVSASNAKLILADGASLTLNASLYSTSDIPLNIYAQKLGTGKLTIKVSDSYNGVIVTNGINGNVIVNGGIVSINGAKEGGNGIDGGGITVNGGTVSINGGENGGNGIGGINGNITVNDGTACVTGGTVSTTTGKALSGVGILRSTVTVNGGILTVAGGKDGGTGIQRSKITVNGGELNVEGGYDDINGGNGIEATDITVTGGFAVVNGGKAKRLSRYGKACIGSCDFNDADVLGSEDGELFEPFNSENENLYHFLKFSPKVGDENGEQPGTANPEQQTPEKGNNSQKKNDNEIPSPDTGDTSNPTLWIVLFAVSLSVIVICLLHDKKRIAVK